MMLRPTESKIIFIQQFGRGLRKAKGKKIVNVIDFIGNHKTFLEKPAALFDFDVDPNSMGKFIENYKNNNLKIPDDCRIFYDPETIDFFTQYSLKMKKKISYFMKRVTIMRLFKINCIKVLEKRMLKNYLTMIIEDFLGTIWLDT